MNRLLISGVCAPITAALLHYRWNHEATRLYDWPDLPVWVAALVGAVLFGVLVWQERGR